MASLTRVDATERAALVEVTAYELDLDLDTGQESFESTSRVRFACRRPGESTFVDIKPQTLHRVCLNGTDLDLATFADERMRLPDLRADNELVVVATMRYSRDGQGLHRSVDSADGSHYVYGQLFLSSAPRVYGCFDQPDLKAPYSVRVHAPADWVVLGNGAATRGEDGTWTLARTKPLATYFVTICAGPYVSVTSEHDGIPLGLHARASLEEPLKRAADELFELTRQCFDYYHRLFGIRFPFGHYEQIFVPEFNAGAMENPGCVTFSDPLLYRGAATYDEVLARANTIAHEMAHMWFGDLVTLRWWDDLWLNESFAEYMSHRTLVAATPFTDAWVDFGAARKAWGYAAERAPSTHPVAGSPAPDAEAALQNFDGISYAKGASVLRQLIAYLGDEVFVTGVRDYLSRHAYGNAELADFLAAMERASGTDLGAWADAWIRTADRDTLAVEAASDEGLTLSTVALLREVPAAHPVDRPHRLDIAGYTGGTLLWRVDTVLDADDATLPELSGAPKPALLLPNAADLTWARVELDGETLAALSGELALVPDPETRAMVWNALFDGLAAAEVDPRLVLQVFASAWPEEDNSSLANRVAMQVSGRTIPTLLPPAEQPAARRLVAGAAATRLERAEPGSSAALVSARYLAANTDDVDLLRRWSDLPDLSDLSEGGAEVTRPGSDRSANGLPPGLEGDDEFRWVVLTALARHGVLTDTELDAALAGDQTMQGALHALTARASLPTAEAKAWAWQELTGNRSRSNYELNALATGFWHAPDLALVRPYVPRYLTELPAMSAWVSDDALFSVALLGYPARVVEPETADLTDEALDRSDLSPAVRRAFVDAGSRLREALASRAAFD